MGARHSLTGTDEHGQKGLRSGGVENFTRSMWMNCAGTLQSVGRTRYSKRRLHFAPENATPRWFRRFVEAF